MPGNKARQKSVKTARLLRGVTRWSLLIVLIGIGAMSLGFWSNQNGNGRGISAIKMRVSSEAAPRAEFSPEAVQSGPLYVRSPETRHMAPMFLDKTQYRAALRENEAEKSVRGGYEALPDNTVVAFADGEVGLRTSLGIMPVRALYSVDEALDDAFTANALHRHLLPGVPLTGTFSAFPERNLSTLDESHYETALGGVCRIPSPYMTAFGYDEMRFRIDLKSDSGRMRLRADRYRDLVATYSARFGLSQDLVYGIMRTESAFNPFAVSNAGALGLMQLMPGTAGGEVHRFLGKSGAFSGSLLFDPEYNIQYGCAYLHILSSRYFPRVADPNSRQLCVIAAYNGGPGAVLRVFDQNRDKAIEAINALSADEVYRKLTTAMPYEESRRYVDKVLGHMRTDYASAE